MKKLTYLVCAVTLIVVLTIVLSPLSNGTSNNPCNCSFHSGYYQYLNLLPGDSKTRIPTNVNVNQTETIVITIQNDVPNYSRYTTISGVYVTLTSAFGHFSGGTSINVGDLPPGTQTVSWQITGTSEGYDYLQIQLSGFNPHRSISFQDSYYPMITIGQPTGPIPTIPATPTPPPTPVPFPISTGTITTEKPTVTQTAKPTSTPPPSSQPGQLQIQLISPTQNEHWQPQTTHTIEWAASGGKEPLNVTLEYSLSGDNDAWVPIATNLSSNGSLNWTTPNNQSCNIRIIVNDSSNPVQTASSTTQITSASQTATSPILPVAIAIIVTIIVLAAIFSFRRKKTGRTKS